MMSFRFFQNKECEYFPCHECDDASKNKFSCLFCYCPLYSDMHCEGKFTILDNGWKDCSNCLIPHLSYDYIVRKLTQNHDKEIADMKLSIKIKYFKDDIEKISKIEKGDWIDLRASEDVEIHEGQMKLIPLGVGMKLPEGYEAHLAPRSSTFKKFHILQTNSVGIIDNSYSGDTDEWKLPAYATQYTFIPKGARICQFRIMERQPEIEFEEVDHLDEASRGGFGSTDTN